MDEGPSDGSCSGTDDGSGFAAGSSRALRVVGGGGRGGKGVGIPLRREPSPGARVPTSIHRS